MKKRMIWAWASALVLLISVMGTVPAGANTFTVGPLVLNSGPSPFASCTIGAASGSSVNYPNAEVEPWVAVNPTNPNNIVAVYQQDRWSDGGAHGLVTAVSHNGGATWSRTWAHFSFCSGGTAANGGDFDRAQRQQQVILAVRDAILRPGNWGNLLAHSTDLYNQVSAGVKTNFPNLPDAIRLAKLALSIPLDHIQQHVINYTMMAPTTIYADNVEQAILRPFPDKIREVVDQTFGTGSEKPMAAPDPNALPDGTYPTYVRDVDVHGATITVDVVQVFKRRAAAHAAIDDGVARRDARYLWIYLRNENDLLRTVPVARDVRIHFIGVCETPPNRHVALTELSDATTPIDTTFYYAITVVDGQIHRVGQHLAISGC